MDVATVAEKTARESYGKLLAYLNARWRDLAAAEDALSDAFRSALETWPVQGIPDRPEAWLLTAAHRRLLMTARHERVKGKHAESLRREAESLEEEPTSVFPDGRLKLLFLCAHPAIDARMHVPLMMQMALGIDSGHIASALLVSPSAMAQRLVRAKAKTRDAGIPFEEPSEAELPARLDAVLEAIYAAYGTGWEDVAAGVAAAVGTAAGEKGLAREALDLARLVAALLPKEPEALGLAALVLHCEARRAARRADDGSYVALSDQNVHSWNRDLMREAEGFLARAFSLRRPGHFQLEAAIQSAHAQRAVLGITPWRGILTLYEGLARLSPTVGVLVGRAAACAEVGTPDDGLAALDELPPETVKTYQPFWALQGHLLARTGNSAEARAALVRAAGLSEDEAVKKFLFERIARLDPRG